MSRIRDIANILSGGSSAIATDAEIPSQVAGKNKLINGAFDFWQRGTSFTSAGYSADRWVYYGAPMGTGSLSRVNVSGVTGIPSDIKYALRYNFTIAGSGYFAQFIEGAGFANGETITISFYARNNSGSAKSFGFEAVQSFGSGGSPSTATVSFSNTAVTVNPGSSFARYSTTISIPSASGKTFGTNNDDFLAIRFYDLGVANIDFTGFQVESGSVMTPFSRAGGDIQGELAKCQRYYYKTYNQSNAPGTNTYLGTQYIGAGLQGTTTSNQIIGSLSYPTMRATPTIGIWDPYGNQNKCIRVAPGVNEYTNESISIDLQSERSSRIYSNSGNAASAIILQYTVSAEL